MITSTLTALAVITISFLLLHVAPAVKHHKLHYKIDNWRPHFGYHPSHYANSHVPGPHNHSKNSKHTRNAALMGSHNVSLKLEHYVVRLLRHDTVICSGIIINTLHILTVTTCLVNQALDQLVVKLFDGSQHKPINSTKVEGLAIGHGLELLVLLQLDTELSKQYAKTPPICTSFVESKEKLTIWSWNKRNKFFKKKKAKQIDQNECKLLLKDPDGIVVNNGTNCVFSSGSDKCVPIFGMPYIWNERFCGLNLMGHNCPQPMGADIYVRLFEIKRYVAEKVFAAKRARLDDAII